MRLMGRVAVVSGGASGIGAATCRAFAAEGAAVVVVDGDPAGAEAIAKEFDQAVALAGDLTGSAVADAAVELALREYGRLDVLAAFALADPEPAADPESADPEHGAATGPDAVLALTDARWRAAGEQHLDATFYFARAALREMVTRGAGAIVTLSSDAGLRGRAGRPHVSAAAAGVLGLTRSLAADFSPAQIRVNAIATGPVAPEPATSVPLGRAATAEEIAGIAVFLASDEASFVFGETIIANGGLLTI